MNASENAGSSARITFQSLAGRVFTPVRFHGPIAAFVIFFGLPFTMAAAENRPAISSPLQVVQAYADAANRGDLEAFLALYAVDIHKFRFPATPVSQGREHMREVYTRSFAEKRGIHVEIAQAIVLGDKVVCRDHVTGLPQGKSADELTVYQVQNGLITNIVYVDRIER